jgi:phosphoribosylanthranilate isomerase
MRRTRVKICGVMRPEDAAVACRYGADAIGMIFHAGSRRNISTGQAAAIIAAMTPFVMPVGVFVDAEPQDILDVAAMLGLRSVQLNGEQSPDEVAELEGLHVIKSIRVTRGELELQMRRWRTNRPANLAGIVLEPGGTNLPGGTGVANDWAEVVRAQQAGAFDGLPLIAAGGLRPETVDQVVREVQPYAVDVSSGVEAALGEKSEEKIREFIAAVRSASAAA